VLVFFLSTEATLKVLKMSLAEFSLPKFYQLFGISKVKSAAVSAFRTSFRPGDRSFTMSPPEHEKLSLSSLETIVDALLEIMEVKVLLEVSHEGKTMART
jgi:neurofibromin 1